MLASAASMQTQMSNPSAPPSLNHLLFLYGNDADSYLFQSRVFLNLGALNYDLVQLSILANAATKGNQHGTVQVFDFGTGPYTGIVNLVLMFCGYYGPLNLGIRLESTTNLSSLFDLDTIILPIDNSSTGDSSNSNSETPKKGSEQILSKKTKKGIYGTGASGFGPGYTLSPSSGLITQNSGGDYSGVINRYYTGPGGVSPSSSAFTNLP